jgi:hypothetical protein
VLKSNGAESKLIKTLLHDARLWGLLRKLLEDQTVALRNLQGSYKNKNWAVLHEKEKDQTEKDIKKFESETDGLATEVQENLNKLTATSQDLIQLVKQSIPSCFKIVG